MDLASQICATSLISFGAITIIASAYGKECSDTFALIGGCFAILSILGIVLSGLYIIWF